MSQKNCYIMMCFATIGLSAICLQVSCDSDEYAQRNERASGEDWTAEIFADDAGGSPATVEWHGSLMPQSNFQCVVGETYYRVTTHECPHWSSADGSGPGGGELMELCGEADSRTGELTIRVRKRPNEPNETFGKRPYKVRVSSIDDGSCGPDTHYFVISDDNPYGINTDELRFKFDPIWTQDETMKTYCVTASVQPDDPGYEEGNHQQQSWWYSDKLVLSRYCL